MFHIQCTNIHCNGSGIFLILQRTGGPCQVRVQVVGLPPSLMSDTEHGIHVHEYGDLGRGCYAAGPHYDSDSFSFHGSPNNLGT